MDDHLGRMMVVGIVMSVLSRFSVRAALAALALLSLALPATANAAVVFRATTAWSATTTDPTANSNWNTLGYTQGSDWVAATDVSSNYPPYSAIWSGDSAAPSVWFRYKFTLSSLPTNAELFSGIDDVGEVYINGALVRNVPCCASNGASTAIANLVVGDNIIAVAGRNTGGPGGLVADLSGDFDVVPLPPAVLMFAAALGGLGAMRRRKA